MSKKILASNFLLRFCVTGVEKVAGMILLPVLVARLGVDGYGYFALVMSLSLICSNVLTLRLPLAVIRFYPEKREKACPVVLVGLLYWVFLVSGAISLFLLCGEQIATYAFAKPGMTRLLGATVALGLTTMLYEFVTITLRAENEFRFLSLVDSVERMTFVAVTVLVLWLGSSSVKAVCLILQLTTIGKLLVVAGPSLKGLRWCWPDRQLARKMFAFSLPYLPFLGSVWLLERGPYVFLGRMADATTLGIFAIGFSLAGVLGSAMGPLQTVLYPAVRKAYDSGDYAAGREVLTLSLRFILFVGVFGTVSLCFGVQHIFQLLSIHSEIPDPILLIGLSAGVTLDLIRHIFVTILNLEMNNRVLAWAAPLVSLVSLPLYLVSIRLFGADGAALAFALATAAQTVVLGWYVPAGLRPMPSTQYGFALVCSSAIGGAIQWLFSGFGLWLYLAGCLLSIISFVVTAYWLGGLSVDEKRTIFGLMQRGLRQLPGYARLKQTM